MSQDSCQRELSQVNDWQGSGCALTTQCFLWAVHLQVPVGPDLLFFQLAAAIVSNHISYLDIIVHCAHSFPSFVARGNTKDLPLVGLIRCPSCSMWLIAYTVLCNTSDATAFRHTLTLMCRSHAASTCSAFMSTATSKRAMSR